VKAALRKEEAKAMGGPCEILRKKDPGIGGGNWNSPEKEGGGRNQKPVRITNGGLDATRWKSLKKDGKKIKGPGGEGPWKGCRKIPQKVFKKRVPARLSEISGRHCTERKNPSGGTF